jgi:tape measure domain-containing protein
MATVRELITRLGFSVDQSGAKKAEGAVSRIKNQASQAAVEVRALLAAFVGFQGLRGLAAVADNVQSLEARMGQMTQTSGTAGQAFDEVAKRATAARQDLDAYANLYIRIGNATQGLIEDQDSLLGVIDTISQAMVVGGVASSEQASAMLQLSQAFNKGKLDGDEFRAVMEAMPRAFTEGLANAMGYTDGLASFMEASRNGKMTTDMLVKALQEIGPSIQAQFMAMPLTLSQSFTIINNRFSGFISRMNRESMAVTNVANFFLGAFDAMEKAMDNLVDFLGGPTNALKTFGIVLAAALAPVVINTFIGALGLLLSPITLVVGLLALLGLVIEDVYQWMNGGESVIGAWLGPFDEWKEKNKELLANLEAVWSGIKKLWADILTIGQGVWDVIVGLFTSDEGKISAGLDKILTGVRGVWDAYVAYVKTLFTTMFNGLVQPIIDAFKSAFSTVTTMIQDIGKSAVKFVTDPIKDAFKTVKGWVGLGDEEEYQSVMAGYPSNPPVGPGMPATAAASTTNNTSMNQTINLNVPPGTSQEQQDAIKRAAGTAFDPMQGFSRNMGVYGR